MTVNWDKAIDMLVKDWDKLTKGNKPLDATVLACWDSRTTPYYIVRLYCPECNRYGGRQYFDSIEDAQKWLAEQLSDMVEEEFRRQVAEQVAEEEKKDG
jgi:phage terminase large subunit-like protein